MKTRHLLAHLAMCCAAAVLVGCTTTHQMSESWLDEKNRERDVAASSKGSSQPVILADHTFRSADLGTNGPVALDESRHLNTDPGATEDLWRVDESDDGQTHMTEFPMQATKHSEFRPLFGDPEQFNNGHSSWDSQKFQPEGLRLFSMPF